MGALHPWARPGFFFFFGPQVFVARLIDLGVSVRLPPTLDYRDLLRGPPFDRGSV